MAENTLEIILDATNNASAEIQKVQAELNGIENATNEVTKKTEVAGKTIKEQFQEGNKNVMAFRRSLFLVVAAIALVISTTKEAAKYSKEVKDSYDEFDKAIKTLSVTAGTMLAPALEGMTILLNGIFAVLTAVTSGFIKLISFIAAFSEALLDGANPIEAYKRAMDIANIATDGFLNKINETKAAVAQGLNLEKLTESAKSTQKNQETAATKTKLGWQAAAGSLNDLGAAMSQASVLGKSWAKAAAGIAIGMAIINTATGITAALAGPPTGPPWPFNIAMAALVAATGAIQIATIIATSFHKGGIVKAHNGLAVDEVPIIAQTGEGILSRRGMNNLGGAGILNALNAGQGLGRQTLINIEINYPTIQSADDIDALTEAISLRLAREAERI